MNKLIVLLGALFSLNASASSLYLICNTMAEYKKGFIQTDNFTLAFEGEQSAMLSIKNYDIEISKTAKDKSFNFSIHKDNFMVHDEILIPDTTMYYSDDVLTASVSCTIED
jgi:hypothetical protein